jgi:CspA family cold shock protein
MRGKVQWFDDQKGFGFIKPADGQPDVFCHFSDIDPDETGYRTLADGQAVEFEIVPTFKGPKAVDVRSVAA